MAIRELTESDVEFEIFAEVDDISVRGNASGWDPETDKAVEDEILRRLENGDIWAWAAVEVRATWGGFSASDYLGACSYENILDFKGGGYYDDMRSEALRLLNAHLSAISAQLAALGWEQTNV